MTIAISLKVNDGVVLAADSASTLIGSDQAGQPTSVMNVYNNANKVFNLRKGLPIGAISWGSGSIGPASITTLAKDLRQRFTDNGDWCIDSDSYSIRDIAERVRDFMFDEHYKPAFKDWSADDKPVLGFVVAGYSSGEALAEEYQFLITGDDTPPLVPLRTQDEVGVTWNGEPEAVARLLLGFGTDLPVVLKDNLGVPQEQVGPALNAIQSALALPLVSAAMPFQDAIDLAEFLVDLTIKVSRFAPGAPTVGGPIEVAAISKHEGFKWVQRKHYFSHTLNPEEGV